MKKIKIFNILLLSVLIFTSCEDELEILPEDQLTPGELLADVGTIEGAVLGVYSNTQSANVANGTAQIMSEWQADNAFFRGSFPTFRQVDDYTTLADNTSIQAIWQANLNVVEDANFIINSLPEVELITLTDELRNQFIGEARFLRAYANFNLTKWFSHHYQVSNGTNLSVPIVLENFQGDAGPFLLPRNTLNEVYDQIAEDLEFGIDNLPATYSGEDTRSRATQGAAKALLARLELYRDNNTRAAELANEVIMSPTYTLATDYGFYNTLAPEFIFSIVNLPIDSQASNEGYTGLTNPNPAGRGDAPFSADLINAYDPADLRFTELTQIGTDAQGNATAVFTTKYSELPATRSDDAPVLRITEMYLIRAEANLKEGTAVGDTPLNDINLLRSRAGLASLGAVTIDNILEERRKELAFEEGHRRSDLLRNGRSLRSDGMPNAADSAPGANLTIFPIPTREIDINPNLVQNPGY